MDMFDFIFSNEENYKEFNHKNNESQVTNKQIVKAITSSQKIKPKVEQEKPLKFIDHLDKLLRRYDNLIYAYEYEYESHIDDKRRKFENLYKFMVRKYSIDDDELF